MSDHMSNFRLIALNLLIASPRNVRRKDRKADIDALAESIAAHGLIQNLCVVPAANDKFEVNAGGRRLQALKKLARDGVIARTHPVPCQVGAAEDGREVSLVENVHRVGMDAMDEVDAFAALVAEGASADDVARRFGVTRRHVDQRLVLSALSPRIKSAWKRGDVTLDAARAFCLVDDHARQDAVFRSLGRPVTHPATVRARLMEGRMRASDRLVAFVGLEAYELAGGAVVRDLFDADAVYVGDPALIARLATEKLEAEKTPLIGQGWGWVEIELGARSVDGVSPMRLQPDGRPASAQEAAELERLQADLQALDDALEADGAEDDERWDERDTLSAKIESHRQSLRVWDRDLIAHAGVVLSIDHQGALHAAKGVVRKTDEKAIRAIRARRVEAAGETGRDLAREPVDEARCQTASSLPKAVARDLSRARTRAIRLLLTRDREAALAVAVASMIVRSAFRSDLAGVAIAAHSTQVDDLEPTLETRGALLAHLPDDEGSVLSWCLAQPAATLMSMLALLVGDAVDLTHEAASPADERRQALGDELAAGLDLDMRAYWQADAGYWTRLSKSHLLETLMTAPGLDDASAYRREATLKAYAKLKRSDLAEAAEKAFAGSGYLPDMLVTPLAAGALTVTGVDPSGVVAA